MHQKVSGFILSLPLFNFELLESKKISLKIQFDYGTRGDSRQSFVVS